MLLKYVGEPKADGSRDARGSITLPGISKATAEYRFPAGVAVEVDDEALAKRLSTNSHFKVATAPVSLPDDHLVDPLEEFPTDDAPPKRKYVRRGK
jgi:hypothetical protein